MTIKEALEVLNPFKACMFDQHGCPISDAAIALDLAIAALEKQEQYEQAEAEGRLMVLPCKVDDTVYEPTNRGNISEYKIRAFKIGPFDSVWVEWDIVKGFVYRNLRGFNVDELGKTVFTSREAAEAALKEAQQE